MLSNRILGLFSGSFHFKAASFAVLHSAAFLATGNQFVGQDGGHCFIDVINFCLFYFSRLEPPLLSGTTTPQRCSPNVMIWVRVPAFQSTSKNWWAFPVFNTFSLVPAWAGGSAQMEKTYHQSFFSVLCAVCHSLFKAALPCNKWGYMKEGRGKKLYNFHSFHKSQFSQVIKDGRLEEMVGK